LAHCCRWRDASKAELAEYKPRYRKQAEKKLAKKRQGAAGLVARSEADLKRETNLISSATAPSLVLQLFRPMEFRGICVQNKSGEFPCPSVGRLLERGVSLHHELLQYLSFQAIFLAASFHSLPSAINDISKEDYIRIAPVFVDLNVL
jgi:hypothetical protein